MCALKVPDACLLAFPFCPLNPFPGDADVGVSCAVLIPLLNNDTIAEGPLASVTFQVGSVAKVKQQLIGSTTRLELPGPPGEAVAIAL